MIKALLFSAESAEGNRCLRRTVTDGAWIGLLFGFACAGAFQLQPRLSSHPGDFTGAPVGLDEWVYFALARAVWRSPNGITYVYPFSLFWPTPPVLTQIPITVAAWIAALLGLPLAFELLRVVGSSLTGAALGAMGHVLFRTRNWRRWFYLLSAFGGSWFTLYGIWNAVETAGIWGLTELHIYVARVMAPIFWWLPFLAQNIWQPLEAIYHALVIGAIAAIALGRVRFAAVLGLVTWFSNPFPAASLYVPVLSWLCLELLLAQPTPELRKKLLDFVVWGLTALVGYGYYAFFLPQWPVLRELAAMHCVPLAPPPTMPQLTVWFGPFLPAVFWGIFTPHGRKRLFRTPAWRLIVFLYFSQILFLYQFWALDEKAIQPYHFNRGYLALASFAVFIRWIQSLYPRRSPRLVAALLCTFVADQASFFAYLALEGINSGFVPKEIAQVARIFNERDSGQLFASQAYSYSSYLAAYTNQIPYDMPETMVVPWPTKRTEILAASIQRGAETIENLGISLFVVFRGDSLINTLTNGGWKVVGETSNYVVLELPKEKRRQVPHLPPPDNHRLKP